MAAVVMLFAAILPTALADTTAWVYTNNRKVLNMRTAPSADADIKAFLAFGTKVIVLNNVGNGWAYIQVKYTNSSDYGYVMTRYLTYTNPYQPTPVPDPTPDDVSKINWASFHTVNPYAVVARPSKPSGWVNLRWAPSQNVDVIERCYSNYMLTVLATNGTWAQAYDPQTGVVGFIMLAYTSVASVGVSLP